MKIGDALETQAKTICIISHSQPYRLFLIDTDGAKTWVQQVRSRTPTLEADCVC